MKFLTIFATFLIAAKLNEGNNTKAKIENQKNGLEENQSINKQNVQSFWDSSCFDLYDTKYCKVLRDEWRFCDFASTNRMDEMCRKTCGFCKQAADCSITKYKCCPDKITPKEDIVGSNCPACEDKYKQICPQYSKDCNEVGWPGQWMRENCKITCGLCKEKNVCEDDKSKRLFCKSWKSYGMCSKKGSLMKKFCKKTCEFCDKNAAK